MNSSKIGWVKIHRRILDWEWYSDLPARTLFLHLILTVNHTDASFRNRPIIRSQRWTSIGHLASETGLSVKQVRAAIEKLESTGEIDTQGASDGTMITICKYDSYQEIPKPKGKQKDEQMASEGQTDGQTKGDKQEEEEGFKEQKERKENKLPPKIEEVIAYFKEKGYSEASARRAFDYYEASITETKKYWSDGKGNPILNWKMKMQIVWFKDENKEVKNGGSFKPTFSGPIL